MGTPTETSGNEKDRPPAGQSNEPRNLGFKGHHLTFRERPLMLGKDGITLGGAPDANGT